MNAEQMDALDFQLAALIENQLSKALYGKINNEL